MATTRKQMYLEKLGNSNFSVPTPVTMEEELLDGMSGATLPTVTSDDEGKILMVDENGKWISAYDEDRVDYKRILKGLIDRSVTEFTIPNGITEIGTSAFYSCKGLTSINIPNGIIKIGMSAFYGCTGLVNIIIPNSITNIGMTAFTGCTELVEINIPDNVTNIGNSAFRDCLKLISITIRAITPPTLGTNSFSNISPNAKIYVPVESVDAYKAATNWSTYASIIEPIPEE